MLQLTMVGATFRPAEAKEKVRNLRIGETVQLHPDPDNEYDEHAVAVYDYEGEVHLGFIPRDSNSAIFAVLMGGASISATVIAFESMLKPVLEIELPE